MKRTMIWQLILIAALTFWALPACDNGPSGVSADDDLMTREQTLDLDDPYGGYNMADEEANFADPMLAADYGPGFSAEIDDATDSDPAVVRNRERRAPQRYLMITWGNLRGDTSIAFTTDWSGSLSATGAALVLKRTVRFDPRDEILPRVSRDLIEWTSYTQPHFDGILVAIHELAWNDSTCNDSTAIADREPITVTFDTAPLAVTLTAEDLVDLHRVVRVDDAGNAVAFNTVLVAPDVCPSGFLAGQWRDVDHRPGGIFRGKWISHNGVHMGYLRGVYGPNSRGEKVFFGKWITEGGRFQGLLRGRYDNFGDRPGGWFEGAWVNRSLRVMGGLRGEYRTSEDHDGGGFFRGGWKTRCE